MSRREHETSVKRKPVRPRPHATIKDVARLAGVSIATVSHVINKTRVVREDTAQDVRDAMRSLHYSPDINARSLRNKKTKTVGVIVTDISNQFFSQLASSIEDVLGQAGYSIILGNSGGEVEKERKLLTLLAARRIDGLIIVPAGVESVHLANLAASGTPIVLVDRKLPGLRLDTVTVDNGPATQKIAELLIQAGHTRIAFITGPLFLSVLSERVDGYLAALTAHGLPRSDELIRVTGLDTKAGYDETVRLMKLERPPTAIIACNSRIGEGTMRALRETCGQLEQEVDLAIWDEAPWQEFLVPGPFALVCQPMAQLGEAASRLLLDRMKGEHGAPKHPELHVSIKARPTSPTALRRD